MEIILPIIFLVAIFLIYSAFYRDLNLSTKPNFNRVEFVNEMQSDETFNKLVTKYNLERLLNGKIISINVISLKPDELELFKRKYDRYLNFSHKDKGHKSYIYHISGLKFINAGAKVFVLINNDRVEIFDQNRQQISTINIRDISNAYITAIEQSYTSNEQTLSLGINIAIFGILGPFLAKNKGNVDVLIIDEAQGNKLIFGLDRGQSQFGHYGKEQAQDIIDKIMRLTKQDSPQVCE